jgi:hypothetical protein
MTIMGSVYTRVVLQDAYIITPSIVQGRPLLLVDIQ